jgi:hypothetical protein
MHTSNDSLLVVNSTSMAPLPWRNGTTHVIFEPMDFIARLVALVPKPCVNLTRFHGVFAPNNKYRALVTPAKRGKVKRPRSLDEDQTPIERRASTTAFGRLRSFVSLEIMPGE